MRFKKLLVMPIVFGMLISSETLAQEKKVNSSPLVYEDNILTFSHNTFNIDDTLYVPAIEIAEQLGVMADYNSPNLNFRYGQKYNILSFSTDKLGIQRNGIMISDKEGAKLIDGTVYVPLRGLCQNMGYNIDVIRGKDNIDVIHISDENIREKEYEEKNYQFALSLLQNFREYENVVISPFSLKSLLGMVANGMNGEGRDEILSLFETNDILILNTTIRDEIYESKEGKVAEFNVLNSIWKMNSKDLKWNEEYLNIIKNYFNGTATIVDSQNAARKINNWVMANSKGMTIDSIGKADFDAALINTVYFNAFWRYPFRISDTKEGDFNNFDGTTVKTKFMNQETVLDYYEEVGLQAVTMEYVNTPVEMTFILINDRLDNGILNRIFEFNKKLNVTISIPKFEIHTEKNYKEVLKKMGIKTLFTPEADFLPMFRRGGKEMIGDKVIQKADILINEKGTTESFADYLKAETDNFNGPKVNFIADKPFYYCLRNSETGEIIFLGQLKQLEHGK